MIAIRAARPADAAAIAAIYAPYVQGGTVSFETDAPGADEIARRMATGGGLYPWIVATTGEADGDVVLGYAYATRFRDRPAYAHVVETSIYMDGVAQQRGSGRLLYDALIDTLSAQGFTQAIAVLSMPNDASIKLHEAVGFHRAGMYREIGFKAGRWLDVGFWQRRLNNSVADPRPPRRFAETGVVRG